MRNLHFARFAVKSWNSFGSTSVTEIIGWFPLDMWTRKHHHICCACLCFLATQLANVSDRFGTTRPIIGAGRLLEVNRRTVLSIEVCQQEGLVS